MSDVHVWVSAAVVFVVLCTAAFFYQRSRTLDVRARAMQSEMNSLQRELETDTGRTVSVSTDWSDREAELRDEFEARDAALVRELSRLYDLEKEVRIITGLPAQINEDEEIPLPPPEGQGGPPGGAGDGVVFSLSDDLLPPEVLGGIASPSADLMLQEIRVRAASLQRVISSMGAQRMRIAHTPSIWPTRDPRRKINSPFGQRRDPITRRLSHHKGVDIQADYGSSVLSSADGVVTFSGYREYYGNLIVVDHGYGLETWYGHMSKLSAKVGAKVSRGDVLGKVGSTGRATGPHIHYEVHSNGKHVNPKNYIGH